MTQPLDHTLLSRLKALHEKSQPNEDECALDGEYLISEGERQFLTEMQDVLPQLLAHIEAQDKRLSAVSGLVEALERLIKNHESAVIFLRNLGKDTEDYFNENFMARAALSAWRKNHG